MELTYFKDFRSNTPRDRWDLQQIAETIRSNEFLANMTKSYQKFGSVWNKKVKAEHKTKLPQVAVSSLMEGGKSREHCTKMTGLLFIDFDQHDENVLPMEKIAEVHRLMREDPHTLLGCKSISGLGYHVVVRYRLPDALPPLQPGNLDTKEKYRTDTIFHRIYQHVADYYSQLTGVKMDMQCANVTQLMALSHDPDVVLNEQAELFALNFEMLGLNAKGEIDYKGGRPKNSPNVNHKRHADLKTEEEVEMAIAIGRSKVERMGVEWKSGQHNKFLTCLSHELNRLGCDVDMAAKRLDELYGDEYKDMLPSKVLRSVYSNHTDEHATEPLQKGKMSMTQRIKYHLTRMNVRVRRLALSNRMEILIRDEESGEEHWVEFNDAQLFTLYCMLEECIPGMQQTMLRSVLLSDFTPLHNPMQDYFKQLPEWDGTDYVQQVADTVHLETEEEHAYFTFCLRRWLVAMVATWLSSHLPKDKRKINQQCLILCGEQGIFKTTFLGRLLPPDFEHYECVQDVTRLQDKDEVLRSSQFALVLFDEIHIFRERDMDRLKSLLTILSTDEREAFGVFRQHRPRIASYCGCSNHRQILSDLTGNRRWMPFWVVSIDSPYEHAIPYPQLYAQLLSLYRSGFRYWFNAEETRQLEQHNEEFRQKDQEEELVTTYYVPTTDTTPTNYIRLTKYLTTSEILSHITVMGSLRRSISTTKMGSIMRKLGFVQGRNHQGRYWIVLERPQEEIDAMKRGMRAGDPL